MVAFPSVALVLSARSWAQIGFSIVQPIAVDMIDEHVIGDFEHLAVQVEPVPFAFLRNNRMNRVKGRAAFDRKPFVSGKPEEIIRIDEGVLALGQSYPAERIAVPKPPIQEHRLDDDPNQPEWNGDGELNLAAPPQVRVNE